MTITCRELDLADRAEVAAFLDLGARVARELDPDHSPRTVDDFIALRSTPFPGSEVRTWLAFEEGRLVATGETWGATAGEPDSEKCAVYVDVDAPHRRRGIGTQVLRFVEAQVPERCTELLGELEWLPDGTREAACRGFAERHGYRCATEGESRRLDWPVAPGSLDGIGAVAPGYTLVSAVDGLPAGLRQGFGRLHGMVSVDAPSGDVEWEATPISLDRYQERLDFERRAGRRLVETVATHGGEVVALTAARVPLDPARSITVDVTYVHPAHRGLGLGLAVKAEIERRLLRMDLANPYVHTYNDRANRWMIAVNETLGFRVDQAGAVYRRTR